MEQQELTHSANLLNLLEVDFTVWNWHRRRSWKNERRTWYTKSHRVGLWGLSGVSSTLPYLLGCAMPVGTSMCSATIVTSTCVKDVHLCKYIYIYIIYVCNITWPTYQCDTPQYPPFLHISLHENPFDSHSQNPPFFPIRFQPPLYTRPWRAPNWDAASTSLRLSGDKLSEVLAWCKWIMNEYCIDLYIYIYYYNYIHRLIYYSISY